jgi:integrase
MGVYRRGRIFYIDYWFEGYRVRECVGPDRKLAEAALAARKGEIVQGRFRLARINDLRLDVFSRHYLEYARTDKKSWDRDERLLQHLLRFFGGRKLHDISPFLVEVYKKRRQEEVKPATVNREVALLKHMYNLAIQWKVASENPVEGVKLLHEEPFQERVLNKEEADRLLAACTSHSRPVVLCALNTAMRIGEITS